MLPTLNQHFRRNIPKLSFNSSTQKNFLPLNDASNQIKLRRYLFKIKKFTIDPIRKANRSDLKENIESNFKSLEDILHCSKNFKIQKMFKRNFTRINLHTKNDNEAANSRKYIRKLKLKLGGCRRINTSRKDNLVQIISDVKPDSLLSNFMNRYVKEQKIIFNGKYLI